MNTNTNTNTNTSNPAPKRGGYGQYSGTDAPGWALKLVADAEAAGTWDSGIERIDRRHTRAVNADIYGWGEVQGDKLAVIQVRQAEIDSKYGTNVQKQYLLLGRTEDGTVFAHGIESPRRSKQAMASPEATVRWSLAHHVWHCDDDALDGIATVWHLDDDAPDGIVRQCDIALIPERRIPASAQPVPGNTVTMRDSHKLTGQFFRDGRTLYARGQVEFHTPGEHKPVPSRPGVWRVQEGTRAALWGFVSKPQPQPAPQAQPRPTPPAPTGFAAAVAAASAAPKIATRGMDR